LVSWIGTKLGLNLTKITNIEIKLDIEHWIWHDTLLGWHVDI